MIFCFSGTGNSRYIARRFAEALQEPLTDLNAKIRTRDTSPIQTGRDVILIAPTYAWRIPRVVSDWLIKTEFASAERIWFVMDCGSEIGDAAKYNRRLAEQKNLQYMGTAQIVMPENYIALFATPEAEEAGKVVEKAQSDVEAAIASVQAGRKFPAPRNNMGYRIMSGIINPFFYRLIVKADPFRVSDACVGCEQCASRCSLNNIEIRNGKPRYRFEELENCEDGEIGEELEDQVVVAKFATTTQHGAIEGKTQTHMTEYYNLDVIISVGYRVKSKRGVEFRRWANSVLKKYILQGYAVNDNRIVQLGEVIRVMKNRKLSGMEVNTK